MTIQLCPIREGAHVTIKVNLAKLFIVIAAPFTLIMPGEAQQLSAPDPQPATIIGTVVDVNGGVVPYAAVSLSGPDDRRKVNANDNGFFQFANAKPDVDYHVSVSAPDFAPWDSSPITLTPGQYFMLSGIRLRVATVQISVVALTPEQVAAEQVRKEEKHRVMGFIPDFYINFDEDPAAMTAKLKFQLALKALNDPVTLASYAADAGIYQAGGYPDYRGGMAGYDQRLAATVAGSYAHLLMADAILPSLLRQDPRYFYQGSGSARSRALHAFSSALFARGDDGRREINYSGIGGDLFSGAVENAYYPARNRGGALVLQGALIGTGGRITYALAEEFVFNRRRHSSR